MYRLSKLKYVFPIGLLIAFFLDGSLSKVFSATFFSYPYSMVSHLLLLWLVLGYFFEGDVQIPLVGFAAAAGAAFDLYYSGILGLFLFLFPLIIGLTKMIGQFFTPSFLSAIMIYFIDLTCLEFVNYIAYSLIGVASTNFANFLLYTLGPTLALNLVYFVILYFPISVIYSRFGDAADS